MAALSAKMTAAELKLNPVLWPRLGRDRDGDRRGLHLVVVLVARLGGHDLADAGPLDLEAGLLAGLGQPAFRAAGFQPAVFDFPLAAAPRGFQLDRLAGRHGGAARQQGQIVLIPLAVGGQRVANLAAGAIGRSVAEPLETVILGDH